MAGGQVRSLFSLLSENIPLEGLHCLSQSFMGFLHGLCVRMLYLSHLVLVSDTYDGNGKCAMINILGLPARLYRQNTLGRRAVCIYLAMGPPRCPDYHGPERGQVGAGKFGSVSLSIYARCT
jgi:hypothetical protein